MLADNTMCDVCRVDQWMSTSFATIALPMAAAITSVVVAVEYASPWKTEVITTNMTNLFTTASWSPIFSGIHYIQRHHQI